MIRGSLKIHSVHLPARSNPTGSTALACYDTHFKETWLSVASEFITQK